LSYYVERFGEGFTVPDKMLPPENKSLYYHLQICKFSHTCQALGLVLDDFSRTFKNIKRMLNTHDSNFVPPNIEDTEKITERYSRINNEIENLLLNSPDQSILGFSAIRILFESYILMMTKDKIRSNLRTIHNNNKLDVSFSNDIYKRVFDILVTLFPKMSNMTSLFGRIHNLSSQTIHLGNEIPTYLVWTTWEFISSELKKAFNELDPVNDSQINILISKLKGSKKLNIKNNLDLS
jgi:hypothetical protein